MCTDPQASCIYTGSQYVCQVCGHIGQQACAGNMCLTGMYAGGRCVENSPPAMCSGSTTYIIGVRSAYSHCGYQPQVVHASSMSEADTCALRQAQALPMEGDAELATGAWNPDIAECASSIYGNVTDHIAAYSDADARDCAQYNCLNCTISAGECQ
jgi:hypothetical protein